MDICILVSTKVTTKRYGFSNYDHLLFVNGIYIKHRLIYSKRAGLYFKTHKYIGIKQCYEMPRDKCWAYCKGGERNKYFFFHFL